MKKAVKKIAGIVILAIILSSMAACTKKAETTAAQAASGPVKVTLHTWRTDVNQLFTEKGNYPKDLADKNIEVELVFVSGSKYEETMKANWAAGMAGEVMSIQIGSQYLESIPYLRDMTPLANKNFSDPNWKNTLFKPGSFAGLDDIADGLFCLPVGIGVQYMIMCNQDMFDANNLQLPKTYEDLKAVAKVFRSKNMVPLSWGFKEPDQSVTLLKNIISDFDPKVWEGLEFTGGAKFTDDIPRRAFTILKEMLDSGILNENFVATIPADAQDGFYQQKAAMAIQGGWVSGIYTQDKYEEWLKAFKQVVIPLPDFNGDGKAPPMAAGPNVAFSIPTTTKEDKLDAAFEVVKSCTLGDGAKFLHDNIQILPATLANYTPQIERRLSAHEIETVKDLFAKIDGFILNSAPPYRIFNPIVKSETFVALGEVLSNQASIDKALTDLENRVKDSRAQYNFLKK
jgi:raffinose/stachyose/melibiose transport system substrate-binding protein